MTRALSCLVATVCVLVLLLAYRAPRMPQDRPIDHVAVAPAPPVSGTPLEVRTAGRKSLHSIGSPRGWCYLGQGRLLVTGPPAGWSYGHLQVEVALEGRRILDVAVVRLATTNPVSQLRSRAATELLRSKILSSQRADVDVVSGATYTSHAYLHSLQAALDTAHAATTRG
jgi:hypothetical protein